MVEVGHPIGRLDHRKSRPRRGEGDAGAARASAFAAHFAVAGAARCDVGRRHIARGEKRPAGIDECAPCRLMLEEDVVARFERDERGARDSGGERFALRKGTAWSLRQ